MADFDTNDVIGISARMVFDNVYSIVNDWHVVFTSGGPATVAAVSTQISAYMAALYGFLTTSIVSNQTAVSLGLRNETQGTVWGAIGFGGWAGGSAAGDSVALGVCCLGYARTSKPRVQIRKYLGVFQEVDILDGVWQAGLRSAVASAMAYHIAPQTPGGGLTFQGCAFNRSTLGYTFALGVTSSAEAAYQRRRKRGRGS